LKKAIILGGGFAGTTIAKLLADADWETVILEKDSVLGGGCRTYFHGGHPFTYGPRVYYGYSDKIFKWINSIVPIRKFPFELKTYVESDGKFFSYPIHEDDIKDMSQRDQILHELATRNNDKEPKDFEEYWINRVGKTLYNMFVNGYSKKMWMIPTNKVFDIFKWSAKDKPIETGTKEAYKGSYIGYPVPLDGYNSYFDKMVLYTEVVYEVDIKNIDLNAKKVTLSNGKEYKGDVLISTIPIDEFMNFTLGELPYVGRDFIVFTLPAKQVFPGDVRFCHYAGKEPFTRITEFKKITYYESEDTLMVMEIPSKNNKLYPYLTKENMDIVTKYMNLLPPDVFSIGRLGTYKYSTIEQTIVQAFDAYSKITGKSIDGMESEFFGIGDTSLMKDRKEGTGVTKNS
jgi:UDP-galactopyranose mutase